MMFAGYPNETRNAERRAYRRSRRPMVLALSALFLGLTLCGHATPALCATHVYIYMSGEYEDVTSELQVIDGHTYVMTDSPFEVVVDATLGHVYDSEGTLIGYTQDDGPLPPAS